jgi:hypothetical protein
MRTLTRTPVLPRPAARSWRPGWRSSYPVWFPLIVYAVVRLVDVVLIVIAGRHQIALPHATNGPGYMVWSPSPASPGYGSVASNWDGQWYSSIASAGYPTILPRDGSGHVLQNQWGFYPVYPLLAGAIMGITGLSFMVIAPALSFALGAGAMILMFRLVHQLAGRFAASATVLLACTYMAAPAMQIAYTESLALLLLCTALLLLRGRRYGWLIPVLVTLALTRSVALAFAPVVVIHGISRYRRRSIEPFAVLDRWRVVGLAGFAVAVTGLWPAIAALSTGDPGAYTRTMSAWGLSGKLRILTEFPVFAWEEGGVGGLMVLLAVIALVAVIVLRRGASAWGPEVRAWAGFYPLYLLLATAPGTSNIRHLFLAFPLMWPFPDEAHTAADRRARIAIVVTLAILGLLLQWFWVSQFLVLSGPGKRPSP